MTAALVTEAKPKTLGEKFTSLDGWIPFYEDIRVHGASNAFSDVSLSNLPNAVSLAVPRDENGNPLVITGAPPIPGFGSAKGIKTFADIIKGLTSTSTKQGPKYVAQGKDLVVKIYKSLREMVLA